MIGNRMKTSVIKDFYISFSSFSSKNLSSFSNKCCFMKTYIIIAVMYQLSRNFSSLFL